MKHLSLFVAAIGVILVLLSLPTTGSTGAHPALQVTITPTAFAYLPFVAKNWPPTPTPTPTPTLFVHPVEVSQDIIMYNAYDLNRTEGIIECNAGPEFNVHGGCPGGTYYKVLGTMDNHPGYDYGSPICGDYPAINGAPVNGMNLSTMGEVIYKPHDGLWIDQGIVQLTNGELARVVLKFGHINPLLNVGDNADYTTTIGELEETCQEVELQVLAADPNETSSLFGIELKNYLSGDDYTIDPRLIGLEPFPQLSL